MKVFLVAGARPNFMKIAPIFQEAHKLPGINCKIVHTGQHYDYEMSELFFEELGLKDPFDPSSNIEAGVRYLRRLLDRFGDLRLALAAYNAGPARVEQYKGIPPYAETRQYVRKVLDIYSKLKK